MKRDYRFDVARVLCMGYIVAYVHLYAYIHPEVKSACFIPSCAVLADACLGLFTFISGFLIGGKYIFASNDGGSSVWQFYKKRTLRIIPLFLLSTIILWLIGFNDLKSSINGLLCLSPFIKPRPWTLWYIPVILYCYLITPVISRKSLKWKVYSCLFVVGGLMVLEKVIPAFDKRFLFNACFYMGGVISASCFDWKFNMPHGKLIKLCIVIVFFVLLGVGHIYNNFHWLLYRRVVAGIGVFAILFLCENVGNKIFTEIKETKRVCAGKLQSLAKWLICSVSYASMACYMFHRLFFWMGEQIWNPSVASVKWLYMGCLVFPLMLVLSYYIQKYYDYLIKRL